MIVWSIEFKNKKYGIWYNNLIVRAKNRTLPKDCYVEIHHIIPKSFTSDDSPTNLVRLTAREHYIAHLLLWKMQFVAPYHRKMNYALNCMMNKLSKANKRTYKINSRLYQSMREEYSELMKIDMSGEGNHFYGKKHSSESLAKMLAYHTSPDIRKLKSERVKGDKNPSKLPGVGDKISKSKKENLKKQKESKSGYRYDPKYAKQRSSMSKGASNGNAKRFIITAPTNEKFEVVGGFKKFCKDNNLDYSGIRRRMENNMCQYKGWNIICTAKYFFKEN